MASDAPAPAADLATSQAPSDEAAPAVAQASAAPLPPSPTLPKLEPYRLRTPLPAAYLVRDFIAPADEVRDESAGPWTDSPGLHAAAD